MSLLLACVALIEGCVLAPVQAENRGDENLQRAERPVIKEIHSKTLDDKTIVTIRASAPFEFVAYKLRNPNRLAVELASAKSSLPGTSVNVGDRLVGTISILKFNQSEAVRMEIELKSDSEFETKMNGSSLDVILTPIDNSELRLVRDELGLARNKVDALGLEIGRLNEKIASLKRENGLNEGIIDQLKMEIAGGPQEKPDDQGAYAAAPREVELVQNDDALIRESLMGWYTAWKGKDIDGYSALYADTFKYKRGGKTEWIKSKRKKFKKSGIIEVMINDVAISISEGNAVVSFTQHYKSARHEDVGIKTLTMIKTDDGWKIEKESWRAMK